MTRAGQHRPEVAAIARRSVVAGHAGRQHGVLGRGEDVEKRDRQTIGGSVAEHRQHRTAERAGHVELVHAAAALHRDLRCGQRARQVQDVTLAFATDIDAGLRQQVAGERDRAAGRVHVTGSLRRRCAVWPALEIAFDIDGPRSDHARPGLDRQVVAGQKAHPRARALDRHAGRDHQAVERAGAVVRHQCDAAVGGQVPAHGERAHRADLDGAAGNHSSTGAAVDRSEVHRACVDDPCAPDGGLPLQGAHGGLQGFRCRAYAVHREQLRLARGDIAAAAVRIEDAAGRGRDERRVARADAHLIDRQIPDHLDHRRAERAAGGQGAAAARIAAVDVDAVAGAADAAEVGGQRDTARHDVDAGTAGVVAGLRRVDDRQVGAQLHVAAGRTNAVDVHVAKRLTQIDALPGAGAEGSARADIGLQRVGGAADGGAGDQFDAVAGKLGRIGEKRIDDRTRARLQAHGGGL